MRWRTMTDRPTNPTLQEIEESIPDERKNLSFGGPEQGLMDVMDEHEVDMHERGHHDEEALETCPRCQEVR